MNEKNIYICNECSKTISLLPGKNIPECCGKKMTIQLPQCQDVHPEMIRSEDTGEPCDDGRGQQFKG